MSFHVPYLVGNKLTRDHQYWPTILPAQLATLGYTRVTGVDLATILALAWRIKRWDVSSSVASSSGVATSSGLTENVSSSFTIPIESMPLYNGYNGELATREIDIISVGGVSQNYGLRGLRNSGFYKVTGGLLSPDSIHVNEAATYDNNATVPEHLSGTFSQVLQLNYQMFGDTLDAEYISYNPDSKLFYPFVAMSGTLFGHFATTQFAIESVGSNGTLTINPVIVPSITFPLRVRVTIINAAHGAIPATTLSGSLNLTMTAAEFWPCKNFEGHAVYSTTTGARL